MIDAPGRSAQASSAWLGEKAKFGRQILRSRRCCRFMPRNSPNLFLCRCKRTAARVRDQDLILHHAAAEALDDDHRLEREDMAGLQYRLALPMEIRQLSDVGPNAMAESARPIVVAVSGILSDPLS